jgi:hypothetical protein
MNFDPIKQNIYAVLYPVSNLISIVCNLNMRAYHHPNSWARAQIYAQTKSRFSRDPDLGPRFGTPIWDPDLGPRFETLIWDPDLGPQFRTPICDPIFF